MKDYSLIFKDFLKPGILLLNHRQQRPTTINNLSKTPLDLQQSPLISLIHLLFLLNRFIERQHPILQNLYIF